MGTKKERKEVTMVIFRKFKYGGLLAELERLGHDDLAIGFRCHY